MSGVPTQPKIIPEGVVQSGGAGVKGREDGGATSSGDGGLEEEVLGSVANWHTRCKEDGQDGVVSGSQGADLVKVNDHVDRQPSIEAGVDDQTVNGGTKDAHVQLDGAVGGKLVDRLRVGRGCLVVVVEIERSHEEEGSGEREHVDRKAETQSLERRLVEGVEQDVVGSLRENGQTENIEVYEREKR